MLMTKPGVQNPHCEPCARARARCTGCNPERFAPRPSTVTTCWPSHAYRGKRHAFTARCVTESVLLSYEESITVHAPHPPSPQPSFVPDKPMPEISFRSDFEKRVDRAAGALLVGVRGDLPRVASASWPRRRFFEAPDEGTRGLPGARARRVRARRAAVATTVVARPPRARERARGRSGGARRGGRGGDEISRTRHVRHVVAGAIVGRWGQFAPRRTSKEREQGRVALALGQDVALAVDIRDRGGVLALHRVCGREAKWRGARCARGEGEKKRTWSRGGVATFGKRLPRGRDVSPTRLSPGIDSTRGCSSLREKVGTSAVNDF